MKKYTLCFLVCIVIGLFSGCLKDLGNYDYQRLDGITISGIDSSYSVQLGDSLLINPVIRLNSDGSLVDTADYTFEWFLEAGVGYYGNANDIRAVGPVLQLLVDSLELRVMNQLLYLRVTNNGTGVFQEKNFFVNVSSPVSEGWLFLSQLNNGGGRLSMASLRSDGTEEFYSDVSRVGGMNYPLEEAPQWINGQYLYFGPLVAGDFHPVVATANQAFVLGVDLLEYDERYNLSNYTRITPAVTDYTGTKMYFGYWSVGMFAYNRDLHLVDYNGVSDRLNMWNGQRFNASPMVATSNTNTANNWIVYNEDTHTFLRCPSVSASATLLELPRGNLFSYTDPSKELVHLQYSDYSGGEVFALLRETSSGDLYYARFTPRGVQRGYGRVTDEIMKDAERFAVSPALGYLFYTVGGRLYEYNPISNTSVLMADYGNRLISFIKFQPFMGGDARSTTFARQLIVCTYDPADLDTSGIADFYTVPDIARPIALVKSYPGLAKVVDLMFKEL